MGLDGLSDTVENREGGDAFHCLGSMSVEETFKEKDFRVLQNFQEKDLISKRATRKTQKLKRNWLRGIETY